MIIWKSWTTIVEAMVVMLIVTVWIIWMAWIYINSIKLSNTTQNRLTAIDISKEWIEAMTNIRDTNWMIFAANTDNCWNVLNYNNCISTANDIPAWSYIIYTNSDNRWYLTSKTTWSYSSSTYRTNFWVKKDANWFFTQTWWTAFKPTFTREIKITYNNADSMNVSSIVRWSDSSKTNWNFEVKLDTVLTNWKK